MHQPEYADPGSGEYALPWTRLHAVKDYDEMADVLGEHPGIRTTMNLTPVLCEQIQALAGGTRDIYWSITEKPAAYLTQAEREFVLSNFFKANFETMIRPYERYAELYFERGQTADAARIREAAQVFGAQKLRDLQVWANLAWSSETLRQTDPVVKELMVKGRDFTEEEKSAILGVHQRVLKGVLEKYRKLGEAGIVELSTTPYYHPILPLLVDMTDSKLANPDRPLPNDTRPFLEDAKWHVQAAQDLLERISGRRPVGMWPAEGSVSEKACSLLASCGVRWAATDELILKRSLMQAGKSCENGWLSRVYRLDTSDGPLHLFFRNHDLSDRIGFTYSKLAPEDACRNFIDHVKRNSADQGVVSVILDGENAWEYYRSGSCRMFLTALFSSLERDPEIRTETCSACIDSHPPADVLPRLSPGSWINGNFDIWIGHSEDNAGWDALQKVRRTVEQMSPGAAKDKATRLLRIAQGSDWYWWFGDDHSSQDDPIFDSLFRENLAAIYTLAGTPVPKELREPIKKIQTLAVSKDPTEFFTPTIDGAIRPFYEWMGGGRMDVHFSAGSMHKVVYHLERFYWGFDATTLYFCLKTTYVPESAVIRISIRTVESDMEATYPLQALSQSELSGKNANCRVAAAFGEVLETAIPLDALGLAAGLTFSVSVSILMEGIEIERWPSGANLDLVVPDAAFFSAQWMV